MADPELARATDCILNRCGDKAVFSVMPHSYEAPLLVMHDAMESTASLKEQP